jgi:peptide chain release factor 2
MKQGRVTSAYVPARPAPAVTAAAELPAPLSLEEIRESLPVLAARVEALEELHGLAEAQANRDTILAEMADVSFWNDAGQARRKLDIYQQASSTVDVLGSLRRALNILIAQMAQPNPAVERVTRAYKYLLSDLPRLEFTSWLSGPHDTSGAYVLVSVRGKQAGARHWAAALGRMYLGWARQRGLTATVLGEDASADGRTLTLVVAVSGFGAYGLLRGETGTHRSVQAVKVDGRESLQRLTATVRVLPELADEVLPTAADLESKVRPANRAGLLLPRLTSHVVVHQATSGERVSLYGQLPADDLAAEATRLLRIRLYLAAEGSPEPATGELVRSYVRNTRDKGVHDHRTGLRSVRVKQVLDGELQGFLDAGLKHRVAQA